MRISFVLNRQYGPRQILELYLLGLESCDSRCRRHIIPSIVPSAY